MVDRSEVLTRLNLIEGQVRGLMHMVEAGRPCTDILIQVASVRAALKQVGRLVLHGHLQHCVAHAITVGDDAVYAELVSVIDLFNHRGG